jgi:hypothetical protein
MKKFAILAMLALEIAVGGCAYETPVGAVTTSTSGNWEAQLFGGTGPTAQLNFVTSFSVTTFTGQSNQALDITGFGFYNANPCFEVSSGSTSVTQVGTAILNTNYAGQVTGNLTYTINSTVNSNVLALTTQPVNGFPAGGVMGTSNGTTTTTGTMSNGVAWGTWTLTSSDPACLPSGTPSVSGTFVMCQGTNSCTIP